MKIDKSISKAFTKLVYNDEKFEFVPSVRFYMDFPYKNFKNHNTVAVSGHQGGSSLSFFNQKICLQYFFVCFYIYKSGEKLKKRFFWSYLLFFDRQICLDPFISQKKNFSVYGLHGTQNDRLELTVSTQKSVLKNIHLVPRY